MSVYQSLIKDLSARPFLFIKAKTYGFPASPTRSSTALPPSANALITSTEREKQQQALIEYENRQAALREANRKAALARQEQEESEHRRKNPSGTSSSGIFLSDKQVVGQLKNLLENVSVLEESVLKAQAERIKSPPELTVTLLEHQKIGVDWMVRMEKGTNKGGILADDMGLGKTVQSIACCVLNRSTEPEIRRATLIVAPTSLVLQWEKELATKVKAGVLESACIMFDIVITSYGSVSMEFTQDGLSRRGTLFRMEWHRVILDEAHTVKNKSTVAAQACVGLKSQHRWCLTGTPIQNNVGELYSLIDFLKIQPYCDWDTFRTDIEMPMKQGFFGAALNRLDGRPIIQLPPKTVSLLEIEFSKPEREFYDSLEKQIVLKFNEYLKAGTVMQNYSNVLVLLLRLRQACCHASLFLTLEEANQKAATSNPNKSMFLHLNNIVNCEICNSKLCMSVQSVMKQVETGNRSCSICRCPIRLDHVVDVKAVLESKEYLEDNSTDGVNDVDANDSNREAEDLVKDLDEGDEMNAGEKTIVFTQFRGMMDLCSTPLTEAG
ncbi:hypothetical protein BCR33DRAFT_852287 [Rhizoclosmatium globosum]|uniref:Helicase ATP-binding domain-containing protein n=1 Tax=Rhizoclosmatium globosum TaxID=329046 RepID=A0A1Y2C2L5_9FUNG|nr:hypothetical protein BCR33DRAFT_852287 [Rhizoclosmatium globosum]|eukprot:ORY41278.1 hypothetical protein BCR33DRAFT_852287 [Rhizoclosmatium globosum]